MEDISSVFAQRLKSLRESRGLTLAGLSKALTEKYGIQISKESLTNYEVVDSFHSKARKNEGMSVKYLRCLADFYGVTTDYLLGRTKAKTWDEKILKIQTMTGLNEYSAARLTECQQAVTTNPYANIKARFFLHTINAILESNWFTECLECVWKAYKVVHQRGGGGLLPRYPDQAEADILVKEAEAKFNECVDLALTDKRIVSGEVAKSVLLGQASEWFSAILKRSIEEEI